MLVTLYLRHVIRKMASVRSDYIPSLPYYRAEDFGLKAEKFSFVSDGRVLCGFKYKNAKGPFKAAITLFHGVGAGHRAYLREIAMLASNGYLVYAFDNTGSGESEGRDVISLTHVNRDLEAYFAYLDADKESIGLKRYAVGHSWGGYAALMASEPKYGVSKIVSIAGFTRCSTELASYKGGKVNKLLDFFLAMALWSFDFKYGNASVFKPLRKSAAKVFYIQGKNDKMVSLAAGYDSLFAEFAGNGRFSFLLCEGKDHQPHHTKESEKYYLECMERKILSPYSDNYGGMDIARATEIDPKIAKRIIDFLES